MNNIEFNTLEFNLYELLNVSIDSTNEDIKKNFRRIIKKFHPDKITEIEEKLYYNITLANHILSNPETKIKYDKWLLESHKSHSTLKDHFKHEQEILKKTLPQTQEEAAIEFQKNFELLGKRHGNFTEDNRNLQSIYKDTEKERLAVKIEKEDFSDMDQFNLTFRERKKNGTYCTILTKHENDIVPFTFGSTNYSQLKDHNNMYVNDNMFKYAFELMPVDESKVRIQSNKDALDEYNNNNNMTNTKKKFKKIINDLDF
jgi:curved DNA-binding protein CbpA